MQTNGSFNRLFLFLLCLLFRIGDQTDLLYQVEC